jgi:hypothetical protein
MFFNIIIAILVLRPGLIPTPSTISTAPPSAHPHS